MCLMLGELWLLCPVYALVVHIGLPPTSVQVRRPKAAPAHDSDCDAAVMATIYTPDAAVML